MKSNQMIFPFLLLNALLVSLTTSSSDETCLYLVEWDGGMIHGSTYRTRKLEIETLSSDSDMDTFYRRLQETRTYHSKYPNELVEPMELDFIKRDEEREEQGIIPSKYLIFKQIDERNQETKYKEGMK